MSAWFGKRRFAFRVGIWSVDPAARELVSEARSLRLQPLTMKLLLVLVENRDRITPRPELVAKVWGRRIVTDDALDRQLAKLRAALGNGGNGGAVETLPKTGFRLTLPVVPLADPEKARGPRRWAVLLPVTLTVALAAGLLGTSVLLRPGGGELVAIRPLSFAPGQEVEPALTRDGRWLAFAARRPGEPRFALYVRAVDAESARRISPPGLGARSPAWSPTGERLAYVAREGKACSIMAGALRTARFAAIAPCSGFAGGMAWLGEDRLIVADRTRYGAPIALRLIEVATGRQRLLARPPPNVLADSQPLVAGDGLGVYFVRTAAIGVDRLQRLDLASGAVAAIGNEAAEIKGITYGRDGRLLVSATRRGGLSGLSEVDPEGGAWVQVAPVAAGRLSAAMDGRSAIFEQSRQSGQIWQAGASAGAPRQLTNSIGDDRSPALSPDRSRLAFISDREGVPAIWLRDMASGRERRLAPSGAIDPSSLAWAPNGRSLAVSGRDESGMAMFLLDPDNGRLDRLPLAGQALLGSFSADGGRLYYTRLAGGRFSIVERDLASGRERLVVQNALRALASNDGESLLFVRPFEPGLWRVDLRAGAIARLSEWPQPSDRLNWAVSSRGIWVPDRRAHNLLLLDPNGGGVRESRPLPALTWSSGLSAAGPDLLYALADAPQMELVLLSRRVDH